MPENQNDGGAGNGAGGGDGGAGGEKPWFAADQADYVTNKGWKSAADAVTSNLNLEKLLGADKAGRAVVLPKDDNDAEGIKAFRARIGVPETPDGYGVPDALKNDPIWPISAQVAHAHGIPKDSFLKFTAELLTKVGELRSTNETKAQGESVKELDTLKGEWGGKFDENAEFARRFVKAIGWDEAKVKLFEETFGTAAMLKDFHAFGRKTAEAGFSGGEGGGGFESNAGQQQKLDELRQLRVENKITEADFFERQAGIVARGSKAA